MKLGIHFPDNDFTLYVKAFFEIFVLPTFIEREPGHYVTHLTSAQVVELFNLHFPYLHRYMAWLFDTKHKHQYPMASGSRHKVLHEMKLNKDWLQITEMLVYWDDTTDDNVVNWKGWNNSEFVWTDGTQVYIS
jgi:hypothetical protein